MKRNIETDNYFADLRARMTEHNITGQQLAHEIGVGPDQLSRWLSGKLDPRLSSVARIEAAVEIILEERNGK